MEMEKGLKITHPRHVRAIDITYIPIVNGFLYLVTIIELYSRFVGAWDILILLILRMRSWLQSVLLMIMGSLKSFIPIRKASLPVLHG